MNSTEQEELTISWKSLLLYPAYHWKSVLLTAVVIMLLGCTLTGVLSYRNNTKAILAEDQELNEYLEKKDELEGRLGFLEKTFEGQKNYIDTSVRIQIDPYKAWHASYSVYVDTGYKIMPEMTYQDPDKSPVIAKALSDLLMSSNIKENIADSQELDVLQLSELYTIKVESDNTITIDVIADTEGRTILIMDLLKEALKAGENQLHKAFGSFEIKETLDSIYEEVNVNILNEKNELLSSMGKNHKEILKLRDELEHLSEPDSKAFKLAKELVLIVIVSFLIPYVFYCVKFVQSDYLYSNKELVKRCNINTLGVVQQKKKYNRLEKWARKLEDRVELEDTESCALAAHNIQNYSFNAKKLLVAGDAPAELCKSVTDQLQQNLSDIKLEYCGSFLNCAKSAAALGTCEGVVLVEQCGVSRVSHIQQEIKQITDLEKPLIGCVIVDL